MTCTQITFFCGILSTRRLVPLDESDIELDEVNQEETEGKEEDQTKVTCIVSLHTHACVHTHRYTHTQHFMSDAHIHSTVCQMHTCTALYVRCTYFPSSFSRIHLPVPSFPRKWLKEELQKPQGLPLVTCGRRRESSFPMFGQRGSPCCN